MSSLSKMVPNEAKGGPFGWIRRMADEGAPPPPPPPVEMPTADSETIRRARLRAMRQMVSQNKGRESTMLGGSSTTLGGS